jgi:hypothetical protein
MALEQALEQGSDMGTDGSRRGVSHSVRLTTVLTVCVGGNNNRGMQQPQTEGCSARIHGTDPYPYRCGHQSPDRVGRFADRLRDRSQGG